MPKPDIQKTLNTNYSDACSQLLYDDFKREQDYRILRKHLKKSTAKVMISTLQIAIDVVKEYGATSHIPVVLEALQEELRLLESQDD